MKEKDETKVLYLDSITVDKPRSQEQGSFHRIRQNHSTQTYYR